MTRERWRQVDSLYHAVLEREPEERAVFLRSACQTDEDLRREVESLLARDTSGNGLLDQPAWEAVPSLIEDPTRTSLAPGTQLGPYKIEGPLGAGGMGQVYKARDTRLGRDVAIKISAQHFSDRFEREARAIAALNHPHICTVHDVGPNYLVMELVEGQTLADRLKKGALRIEQVLQYGAEIADALAAAHARGIIHRDLKPGNIMLTKSGVKVLDFGLAKSQQDETMTSPQAVMGSPAYMAPEQRDAKPCDARTDIYSLGLVLYEMATGKRIVRDQPQTFHGVPAELAPIIERCLAAEPEDRWQVAKDVKAVLEWASKTQSAPVVAKSKPRRSWTTSAAIVTLAIVAAGMSWALWRTKRPMLHPLIRLSVDLGPDALAGPVKTTYLNLSEPEVTISPDASRIVFKAHGPNATTQLATRLLDQAQTNLLPGTENAIDPFFSPDGQWLGFFADGQLKKISMRGGAPVTLCAAPRPRGATWLEDGTIVASLNEMSGLSRISSAGGAPEMVTKSVIGEAVYKWPQVLPEDRAILYTALPSLAGQYASIKALYLSTGERKTVLSKAYFGQYLPSGHLLFMREGMLFGVAFDAIRLEVRGTPAPLLDDVAVDLSQHAYLNFSPAPAGSGTFLYRAATPSDQSRSIVWLDSVGKIEPLVEAAPGGSDFFRFSPDGRRLALAKNGYLSIYDIQRGTMTRLSFSAHAHSPVWTPDGRHILYGARSSDGDSLSWINADGAGDAQVLLKRPIATPYSFSPDGRHLSYQEITPDGGQDLWTLPLDVSDSDHPKPGKPEPFLRTTFNETVGVFSPDGRWIAYRSDESGTNEIYVRPFPGPGSKWPISTGGGRYPIWSKTNRELFYLTLDSHIMVLNYTSSGESFVPGRSHLWSEKQISPTWPDLAPDGKRFAVVLTPEANTAERGSAHVTFLLNFFDELRRRVPPSR
jgi:serine/threonine protein kinase